ncbi:MAG: glycyl-radical enzyme activating protein [Candidatus Thorarchaeota archaeon]
MNTNDEEWEGSSTKKGLVLEIQKLSTEDGPGIRTSVFFKGCPLKCAWCHNPESIPNKQGIQWFEVKCIGCETCVKICPVKALTLNEDGLKIDRERCSICGLCVENCPSTALRIFGKEWTVNELLYEILKDKAYYEKSNGGVTVTGGEPFLQVEFITTFLKKCKDNNLHTALDTCGYTNQKNIEKLFNFVDLFLYDLKEMDTEKHKEFTGVGNEIILENCKWLVKKAKENNKAVWIRTPIIPNYTANEDNIRQIAKFIANELKNQIDRWDLLAFNNLAVDKYKRMDWDWKLEGEKLLTKEDMEYFYDIAIEEDVKNVFWSGLTKKEE